MTSAELGYKTWVANQLEHSGDDVSTFALAAKWKSMTDKEKKIFRDREIMAAKIVSLTIKEKALKGDLVSPRSPVIKPAAERPPMERKFSKGVFNFQGGTLQLDDIRSVLIRLEESIIFGLIERAQFSSNLSLYSKGGLGIENQSFLNYVLHGTEHFHATIRRYTSPDEHPFSMREGLPIPLLPALEYPKTILDTPKICVNKGILEMYINDIIPAICTKGDDQNYGSSAIADVNVLQLLSKRIHYGKFVAEIKFREDPEKFGEAIAKRDTEALSSYITKPVVEEKIMQRVRDKAMMYGMGPSTDDKPVIAPEVISELYRGIIELTKVVEIDYLLVRLDEPCEV